MDLFGKQGASVLPTLKRGFDDLKDSVVGANAAAVKFFDDFGDSIDKASRGMTGKFMNAFEFMFGGFSRGEREAKAFADQIAGIKPPAIAGAGGTGPATKLDTEAELLRIGHLERILNEEHAAGLKLQNELLAVQNTMFHQRLAVNKAITDELKKQSEAFAAVGNSLVLQNLEAKKANNAKFGMDVHGGSLELQQNPFVQLQNDQRELETLRGRSPGIDTSEIEKQINDRFLKAVQDFSDGVSVGGNKIAATLGAVADSAHAGARQVGDAFAAFGGVVHGMMPTVNVKTGENTHNTDPRVVAWMSQGYTQGEAMAKAMGQGTHIGLPQRRASGGPVLSGETYTVGEQGPELLHMGRGQSGSITPNGGGGGGPLTIHVSMTGILMGSDPSAKAQLKAIVKDAVVDAAKTATKLRGA